MLTSSFSLVSILTFACAVPAPQEVRWLWIVDPWSLEVCSRMRSCSGLVVDPTWCSPKAWVKTTKKHLVVCSKVFWFLWVITARANQNNNNRSKPYLFPFYDRILLMFYSQLLIRSDLVCGRPVLLSDTTGRWQFDASDALYHGCVVDEFRYFVSISFIYFLLQKCLIDLLGWILVQKWLKK